MKKTVGHLLIVMIAVFVAGCGSDESFKNTLRQANDNPNDWMTLLNLSKAYEARRNYTEAINTMEKIIPLKPEEPGIYERLASLYVLSDQFDKAIQAASKAVALAEKVGPKAIESANLLKGGVELYIKATPDERKTLKAGMK